MVGRCAENAPAKQRSRVVLLDVTKEAFRSDVTASRPYSTLYLYGYLVTGQSVVETPLPRLVEAMLLDALGMEF